MANVFHPLNYLLEDDCADTGFELDEALDFNEVDKSILSVLRALPSGAPEVEGSASSGKIVYTIQAGNFEELTEKVVLTVTFQQSTKRVSFSLTDGPNSGDACRSLLAGILADAGIEIDSRKITTRDNGASVAVPGEDDEIEAAFGD